jgi:F-type H+-transporting ATPase subunit gamma
VANLKLIRNRIASVKSTQKITRAMKLVAGARLSKAQQRILALRPFAQKTEQMLVEVTESAAECEGSEPDHALLARREEKRVLLLVVTSDRGLCGAFNANINRTAERHWKSLVADGKEVQLAIIGRKGRDYLTRRKAPVMHVFSHVWEKLGNEQAEVVAKTLLRPFVRGEVDSIYLIYNEFKSAMTQRVVVEPLFPLPKPERPEPTHEMPEATSSEFIFEPTKHAVLEQLVPSYIELTILRALYESMASEFGARMTAMDSATKNASEIIDRLTLQYNRARQAAITTELMEIIGGANALKE